MEHCHARIGRIRDKKTGREIVNLRKPEPNVCSDAIHDFASYIRGEDVVTCGAFAVRKDGSVTTQWAGENKENVSAALGGALALMTDIQERERMTER